MDGIYMDNAATTFPKPESVYVATDNFSRFQGGSPGRGTHRQTIQAGTVLLDTREALARLFNITDSTRIAFTPNVTESLNLGLKGWLQPGDHVITTSMEHNAVARPVYAMTRQGLEWTSVKCDPRGMLDPQDIERAIQTNTRMICILHASNLSGTIMPIAEVGAIARDHGIVFMVDTAQTAGVLELDVETQHIDILAFTGHKGLMGPQGTGGIYIRPGLLLKPLKEGGTGSLSESLEQPECMPDRFESGTPNTPGIAGLGAGIDFILSTGRSQVREHEKHLTGMLLQALQEIRGVEVYGPQNLEQRVAVVAFNIDDVDCGQVSLRLEYEHGIITRSGLHCSPLAHQTLGSLERGACRLSPGYFTTESEILTVIKAIDDIARHK